MDAIIIVAGGAGKRMGNDTPKQFLPMAGRPVLMETIERFHRYDCSMDIVVVLPEEHHSTWKTLCKEHDFTIKHTVAYGGGERYFSVRNGLKSIKNDMEIIGVHDGVRPLIDNDTIKRCFEGAREWGSAVPAVKLTDSIRKISGDESMAVDRECYRAVQTPQCFKQELLKRAYSQDFSTSFTDDASVVEATGVKIHLVEGNDGNIKITTPKDLIIAELMTVSEK